MDELPTVVDHVGPGPDALRVGPRLRRGVEVVKTNLFLAWLGGFAFWIVGGTGNSSGGSGDDSTLAPLHLAVAGFGLFALLFYPVVAVGFFRFHENALRGIPSTPWTLIGAEGKYGRIFVARLLRWFAVLLPLLPVGVVAVLMGIESGSSLAVVALVGLAGLAGAIYAWSGLAFAERIVTFEDAGAMDALKQSWALTAGRRGAVVLFGIAQAFAVLGAMVLGLVALCVGIVVTVPLTLSAFELAWTEAYFLLTGRSTRIDTTVFS